MIICSSISISAQADIEGQLKLGDMPKDNSADSVVVRLSDGTLGVRDAASLSGGGSSFAGQVIYLGAPFFTTGAISSTSTIGPMPRAGTIRNLFVKPAADPVSGQIDVTVQVNGVDSDLAVLFLVVTEQCLQVIQPTA